MSVSNFLRSSNFSLKEKETNNQNLDDVLQNLEDLNQIAFEACMKAFRAHGNLNSYQFLLLSHLKYIFSITTEMAKRITRRVADDIELITIAENINPNVDVRRSWENFCCEQTPTAWLSFKNETFANFIRGPFSYINEYNFKEEMSEFEEEKSQSILKRLYTVKQEPFVLDRYKEFLDEIGVSLSAKNNENKLKNKCGRPKKNSTNNNKNQKSQNSIKNNKSSDEVNGNYTSNTKTGKAKTKHNEMSYVGNLGKKEMHTMICQRVIPISETYKQKIINRSIVLRKRVALGEMTGSGDTHIVESYKNSENNTSKIKSQSPTNVKRQKLDSSLSEDTETDGKFSTEIPKKSVFSKTSCYKFLRKPILPSESKSPKFVIRPITCTKKNEYSVPRVIFKANNTTSPRKSNDIRDMPIPLRSNVNSNNNCSSDKDTVVNDSSEIHIQNESNSFKMYKNLPNQSFQQVNDNIIQINGKNLTNINLNDSQLIISTSPEINKHSTYDILLKNDSSKIVE